MTIRHKMTLYISEEQVEQLKCLLATKGIDPDGLWKDWRAYAETLAQVGFNETLAQRDAARRRVADEIAVY